MEVYSIESVADIENDKDIIIYGAAQTGQVIFDILNENHRQVRYFMDDDLNKIGSHFNGVEVLSPAAFKSLYGSEKECILIIGSIYTQTMSRNLEKLQLPDNCYVVDMRKLYADERGKAAAKFIRIHDEDYVKENIGRLYGICPDEESHRIIDVMQRVYKDQYLGTDVYDDILSTEDQYFTDEVLKHISGRKINIIDGGAYQGEILSDLISHQVETDKIFMFEADKINYDILLGNIERSEIRNSCIPINKGLWNEETKLYIETAGDQSRIVSYTTEQSVDVTTIDKCMDKCSVGGGIDFIKMDIEGSELKALKGAERTLKRCRPVLAITIYHSPEDFVGIPIYLSSLLDGYTWKLLHQTNEYCETILYGIPY